MKKELSLLDIDILTAGTTIVQRSCNIDSLILGRRVVYCSDICPYKAETGEWWSHGGSCIFERITGIK